MDFDLKEVTEDPETEALLEAVSTTGGCRLLNVFVLGSDLVLTSTLCDEEELEGSGEETRILFISILGSGLPLLKFVVMVS